MGIFKKIKDYLADPKKLKFTIVSLMFSAFNIAYYFIFTDLIGIPAWISTIIRMPFGWVFKFEASKKIFQEKSCRHCGKKP